MTMSKIETVQKFIVDGVEFASKAEAEAHIASQAVLPKAQALVDGMPEGTFNEDDRGNQVIFVDDLPEFLAKNAKALVEALTPPKAERKPRKKKDAEQPAA